MQSLIPWPALQIFPLIQPGAFPCSNSPFNRSLQEQTNLGKANCVPLGHEPQSIPASEGQSPSLLSPCIPDPLPKLHPGTPGESLFILYTTAQHSLKHVKKINMI